MHRYLPMTEEDKREMLDAIGVRSVGELFSDIPEKVRFKGDYRIKKAKSETALLKELSELAGKNANLKEYASFLGAGVYDHYIPTVVDHVISRSEFYTAYTPYQPEISQGELQAIFEFQTMICELTGMDVANSSMYDGGTSMAEAAMLAAGQMKRKKVLVSKAVHPEYRAVLHTYAKGKGITVEEIPLADGCTDLEAAKKQIDGGTAAVIVQYPNFFGSLERLKEIGELAHAEKALFVVSANLLALGVLAPPGGFRRRYYNRRLPGFRHSNCIRRPALRLLCYNVKTNAENAGAARRRNGRREREKGVCAYAPGARTAYPPQ